MASAPPLLCQVGARLVDGLGDVREVLLGVEAVNDLNGVGEVFVGEVPDPLGPIAEHGFTWCAVEAASGGLAFDARCELAWSRVGVFARRTLDGSRISGGPV